MFCAPSAETAESMEDGSRNMKLMIFSTMPTAAASVSTRWFAMIVMIMKETWMKPSWSMTGTPMDRSFPTVAFSGRKSVVCS